MGEIDEEINKTRNTASFLRTGGYPRDEGRLYTAGILLAGRSIEEISPEELAEPQGRSVRGLTRDMIDEILNKARSRAAMLRTGRNIEKISSEELAEAREEITRCRRCDKSIKVGEEFYSVSFGTSRVPDHQVVTAHGEYCDDCGPMKPR